MESDKISESDSHVSGRNNEPREPKDILEEAKKFFGDKIEGLKNLKWEDIPAPVRNHIEQHPYLTPAQLILLLLTLVPGLIVAPVLGVLGFSSIGPVAGKKFVPISSPIPDISCRICGRGLPVCSWSDLDLLGPAECSYGWIRSRSRECGCFDSHRNRPRVVGVVQEEVT